MMTSTSGSTCHCKRRLATTVCAGVLALAASAILLASNDGLYSSGHRQLKATMAASSSERKIHRQNSGKQDAAATAAAAGKNKRRQLAKDDEYRMIVERKLSTTSAQEKRKLLDLGVGVNQPVFRLESLIGTLLFGSEESGRAKRKLADRIVNSPRNLLTERAVNNRYNPLRKLSLYLLGNGCMVTPAQALPRDQQIETSVVASYPGSGAVSFTLLECIHWKFLLIYFYVAKHIVRCKYRRYCILPIAFDFHLPFPLSSPRNSCQKMTWKLIEALTGIVTGDEHVLNGHQWDRTVSVKTHFPHEHGNAAMGMTTNEQFPRAVLLLRHPKDAIPSYFNYLYEVQHNLPGHSTRAPMEDWLRWRDANYEEQMIAWAQHADFWLSRYSDDPEKILVLGFEGLTDDRGGPASALGLAAFLDRSNGIETIDPEAVPCIWDKIVRYKEGDKDTTTPQTVGTLVFQTNQETGVASKRASGDGHDRPYTEQQLEKMLGLIREVHKKHKSNKQLVQWLRSYETITEGLQRKLWLAQMGCPETGCPPGHIYPSQPLDIVPGSTQMYNVATQEATTIASTTTDIATGTGTGASTIDIEEAPSSTTTTESTSTVQAELPITSIPPEPSLAIEEVPINILQATPTEPATSNEQDVAVPSLPVADPEAAELMHTVEQIDQQQLFSSASEVVPQAQAAVPEMQAQSVQQQQQPIDPIHVDSLQNGDAVAQTTMQQPQPQPQPVIQQMAEQMS